jgi:tetratricopeptide (TPR) repeat protein
VTPTDPPLEDHPPQRLYLHLDPTGDQESVTEWSRGLLPALNWRAHLFLVGDGGPRQRAQIDRLLPIVADHLDEHRLTALSLHPLVTIADRADVDLLKGWRLLELARRFQSEAYREQSQARLAVHPIFAPVPGTSPEVVRAALRSAHAELATPSLLLPDEPPASHLDIPEVAESRLYLRTEHGDSSRGTLATLRAHHVVESVLEEIRNGGAELLVPCRRHLVVDAGLARIFPCLLAWQRGGASHDPSGAGGGLVTSEVEVPVADCTACIRESALSAERALDLGGRRDEARQLCFRLGLALSHQHDHDGAVELALRAAELSGSDADRAAALLHRGLSLLELGRPADADEALRSAARCGADPGLVAYHRGRVQMAWPDEIEALERFEEAAAAKSPHVRGRDLHLEMALAHIRLEEYAEARPLLDAAAAPDNRSAISFLRGVCDLSRGAADAALAQFEAALDRSPEPDDLGRVLLYLATSLKELERFEDALPHLERAVALEPDELAHRNLQGYCYYRLGRHAEAVECFRRAVELDPTSALDWANLGSNLRDLGRVDEAIAAYRRALELDPTIGFAADNLARLQPSDLHESDS